MEKVDGGLSMKNYARTPGIGLKFRTNEPHLFGNIPQKLHSYICITPATKSSVRTDDNARGTSVLNTRATVKVYVNKNNPAPRVRGRTPPIFTTPAPPFDLASTFPLCGALFLV
jgi:hypothetical protein